MPALVVYESMFGSTRAVAEAIAAVLDRRGVASTLTTAAAAPRSTAGYDLVVVGAPTHAHTLPRRSSRAEAAEWASDNSRALTLEATAQDRGVREWLKSLEVPEPAPRFAAFSTRVNIARILAGDAAVSIAKRLRPRGVSHVEKECFLVSTSSTLLDGERLRAEQWAERLTSPMSASA